MCEQNENIIDRNYKMKKKSEVVNTIQYCIHNTITELNDSLDGFNIRPEKKEEKMNKLK